MYSSTQQAEDAMSDDEVDDLVSTYEADIAAYERWEYEQSEREQDDAIAAEERRTAAWGTGDEDDVFAAIEIEGGNGITICNGNLTTVASMVGGVAQMEAFNAAGQSVGVTPFPDTATLLDACRIIATLSAWQIVGEVSP